MRRLSIAAALAILGALGACSASQPTTAPRTTTTVHHAIVTTPEPSPRSPKISLAQAVAARNNPTHDPAKCVRQLANGNVVVTIKDFIAKDAPEPTGPSPFGWCG